MVMVLVNDYHSDVSPVNISDSDSERICAIDKRMSIVILTYIHY